MKNDEMKSKSDEPSLTVLKSKTIIIYIIGDHEDRIQGLKKRRIIKEGFL